MKPSALFLCHLLLLGFYLLVLHAVSQLLHKIWKELGVKGVEGYGGQWRYLTVLNLLFQAIFYGISSLNDAIVLMKKFNIAKVIIPFRDLLFAGLLFPVSLYVCIMFWTIYTYDPELIYPNNLEHLIPAWLNHAMHTSIVPLTLLDLLITPRRYPSKWKGLGLLTIAMVAYLCWMLWFLSVTGKWVYPLFDKISHFSMVALFTGSVVILLLVYNVGAFLCRMIWGDSVVIVDIYKRKSK